MGTNTLFKVTDYPSLEMHLQVKKPNNLGTVVSYLSSTAWKPDRSVMKAKDHQERWKRKQKKESFFPSRERQKIRSVWLSKVSGVQK